MIKFEDSFSTILLDMIYIALEFCDNTVDFIYIHCSNEKNCISSNIFFKKQDKKIKRYEIQGATTFRQQELIHSINEKIKEFEKLCVDNKQAIPTEMKLIYEVSTKNLISDFAYEYQYSNSKDLFVQDIFDRWFDSF